jgi:hypothetical protein
MMHGAGLLTGANTASGRVESNERWTRDLLY